MGRLSAFIFITLDGFLEGAKGDISWHRHGAEENSYAAESLKGGSVLLFGRVTYQMMASYWPTPAAAQDNPTVAQGMNDASKIVFSKTLSRAEWKNTRVLSDNIVEEISKSKQASGGKNMTILGSGTIVSLFAEHGLIDEYQIMVDPVALGRGTPIFKDLTHKLDLTLTQSRTFRSGVVLLSYQPIRS